MEIGPGVGGMVKYEATAVSEMYKEFYQNVVDSNQNYMEKQNAEKVFLLLIVLNYFSLHRWWCWSVIKLVEVGVIPSS